MRKLRTVTVLILLAVASQRTFAADEVADHWGQWRGPLATGVAPNGNPPVVWDEQTNVKWKVPIPGRGSGSPVVFGDKIFLLTALKTDRTAETDPETTESRKRNPFQLVQNQVEQSTQGSPRDDRLQGGRLQGGRLQGDRLQGDRPRGDRPGRSRRGRGFGRDSKPTHYHQFVVLCLDRRTGNVVWQKTAAEMIPHEGHHGTGSFASSSPVTDGKNVYVSFGSRGVFSFDLDGNQRWQYEIPPLFTRNSFGEGASPSLYGDTLVVNCDHEQQSFIVALDTKSGEEKWKKMRDEETSWGTPLIVEHGGIVQVIVNAMNRVRSYDLATGEVLWECGGQASGPVPTPIVHGDLVFCMTGHRGSALLAIPLDARGDITDSEQIAWRMDRDTPYVPSPLIYDDYLYFTKSNKALLTCVDAATGKEQYRAKRLPGMDSIYASPVGAAQRIYIAGRNGTTIVLKHGAKFEVLAENHLDEPLDATPAIVGKEIYLRGEKHLYCIQGI